MIPSITEGARTWQTGLNLNPEQLSLGVCGWIGRKLWNLSEPWISHIKQKETFHVWGKLLALKVKGFTHCFWTRFLLRWAFNILYQDPVQAYTHTHTHARMHTHNIYIYTHTHIYKIYKVNTLQNNTNYLWWTEVFFSFFFLQLALPHIEVPGLGVERSYSHRPML